ncbi:MAG TPA: DUF2993 domain-containing protein [Mycobacteriales bacterium]|nr:DUF2993 domain-containing protein [Mycobacteriales bacterium]
MTPLVVVLALLLVAVVVDRVAVRAAQSAIAVRLETAGGLADRPEVEVRGFPFLTQAVRGRYADVVVRAADVPAGQVRLRAFVVQLRGISVPLGEAVGGRVSAVPVDSLSGRAVLPWASVAAQLAARGLRVAPTGDGRVRVTGRVQVLGRGVEATAVSRPALEGGEVVVTAERFEVGSTVADAVLSRALGNRLDFRLDVGALPYGLRLTGVAAARDGVVLTARADGVVLAAR